MVTYDKVHVKLAYGGSFWGTEAWQNQLRLYSPDFDTMTSEEIHSACNNAIDGILTSVHAYFVSANGGFSPKATLDWCKLNPVLTTGHQPNLSTIVRESDGDPGGANSYAVPSEVSVAISLRSDRTSGKRGHGRYYIPCGWFGLTPTGHIYEGIPETLATAAQSYLNDINGSSWGSLASPLVHIMGAAGLTPSQHDQVTAVIVGDVYDTTRRRRRQMLEQYTERHELDFG